MVAIVSFLVATFSLIWQKTHTINFLLGHGHAQLFSLIMYTCSWYPEPLWWAVGCGDLGINPG